MFGDAGDLLGIQFVRSSRVGRIGGCTDHFAVGTPPIIIQVMGRWDTDCWKIYDRQCVGQTLDYAEHADHNEDEDLEAVIQDYAQPARITRLA